MLSSESLNMHRLPGAVKGARVVQSSPVGIKIKFYDSITQSKQAIKPLRVLQQASKKSMSISAFSIPKTAHPLQHNDWFAEFCHY
jgi:hypothetical protein